MSRALAMLLLLAGAQAVAADAPAPLTVAFTGDNGGEVAPCG